MTTTAYRTCHLCEATCGLELHLDGSEITLVRGDRDDVFSGGYLCPKGTAVKHLDTDPDSIPHGWGHDRPGMRLSVAGANAGVNSNVLARSDLFDPLSGNAVLNGIPVELEPA